MTMTRRLASAPSRARPDAADPFVHPLIRQRSSPRVFSTRHVPPRLLRALFEAARWAPSCYNEQPWRFLVATAGEPAWLARLRSYVEPGNEWALAAPVLAASAYRADFEHNGKRNRLAQRDLGAAEENLFLQACALGLAMHQMAGFDHSRLTTDLLPAGFEPGTLFAIGYPTQAPTQEVAAPSKTGRRRRPLPHFVFGSAWERPAAFADVGLPEDRQDR